MLPVRRRLPALVAVVATTVLTACSSGGATPEAEPTDEISATESTTAGEPTEPAAPTPSRPDAKQSARLTMLPQIAHPGPEPAAAADALSAMTAAFRPVRPGREVVLQRRQDGGWVTVDSARQGRRGMVEFSAPFRTGGEVNVYRAAVEADEELPGEASAPVRADAVGAPEFSDEFDGAALGPVWSHRLQGYSPESSRACSKADPRAARVGGGTVRLSVLVDPDRQGSRCSTEDGAYAYRLNGHISTEDRRSFGYGTVAARIRFQPLRGQHGAVWMQPQAPLAYEGDPADTGAEIDIIEWFGEGQAQGGLTSFAYYRPDADGEQVGGFIKDPERFGGRWGREYHVFSVEWTPESYVFRIDGQETFRTSEGVSGRPEFLILSLLSSDYELPFIEERDLPQHMYVDWVRHWKP